MQKSFRSIKKIVTLFLILAVICAAIPFSASAASSPSVGMIFNSTYSLTGNKLTMTVSVNNPNFNINSAMFVLKYNSSYFSTGPDSVSFLGTAQKSAVYFKTGYIGADWYYGGNSTGLAKSSTPTQSVKIVFTLNSGKSFSSFSPAACFSICNDTYYLDTLNGYGEDGGILLCQGANWYNINSGTASAGFRFTQVNEAQVVRLAGASRVDTSLEIASRGWGTSGANTVIISNGYNFADALAGGPLAAALDAPIILTANKAALESSVLTKLTALGTRKVIILGGTAAVNQDIENQLRSKGYTVERIYGPSRFDTAVAIANKLYAIKGSYSSNVFIAYSHNYPDALAVSPIAAITGTPILFVNAKGTFDSATANYLRTSGTSSATILGGVMAIAADAETNLKNTIGVRNVNRLYGTSRYDTALKICTTYESVYTSSDIAFATGTSFPDALAGGAFAPKMGIPIILTNPNSASQDAINYITAKNPSTVYVFGGTGAVSDATVDAYLGK
ncbi:MAG: cell wall-binding repeat-containing protein [Clostridia bacterium]|nr:cell wall-binding repeat-containing protein [Clostridia bacterium]